MAGLDIYRAVAGFLNAELCARTDVAPLIDEKAAAGRLGIKTGEGLMRYTPDRIGELQAQRAQRLVEVRLALEGRR
jgi:5-formyl-3-hydroxy-2-methylpyridine 4-carboxylate dehydrogenase